MGRWMSSSDAWMVVLKQFAAGSVEDLLSRKVGMVSEVG